MKGTSRTNDVYNFAHQRAQVGFASAHAAPDSLTVFQETAILHREKRNDETMKTISAARANLSKLLAESEKSHKPVRILGKKNSGVLLSLDDWRAIQETLYLLSIPKMRASIRRGLKTPVEKCSPELPW
jgi:antitoxin YefM